MHKHAPVLCRKVAFKMNAWHFNGAVTRTIDLQNSIMPKQSQVLPNNAHSNVWSYTRSLVHDITPTYISLMLHSFTPSGTNKQVSHIPGHQVGFACSAMQHGPATNSFCNAGQCVYVSVSEYCMHISWIQVHELTIKEIKEMHVLVDCMLALPPCTSTTKAI